ncbi:NAD(P)H-dependent flavin oxidoreductase [Capnocytophaga stomatis]|uniref:NAD(P)H-dependent flavin oxidoreductase n=1 Tax=Capnocytophaga stomatis TaxID=1848904 RepID=A0ABW8QA37_9FLAO|nr:nitronate monooxygenase [Capnocytophaga stomatis]GIJ94529.1 2-nitropropane dioxygenase [Capnocytophaga stomatis]GIM48860.1 2-nitropropane dioxygenase [Capnocytophaga stomatis]
MKTRITEIFNIKYPIVQGGMVWASGWRLVSAVSNAGGLGLLGAGSMYPEVLREHIQKCRKATDKPFGVNIPIMYPDIDKLMEIIIEEGVKIVFTSAGNPEIWTSVLQKEGIKVAHVVSSSKFALKAQNAGVDAIVAEGFEAGGHNGREETTTMTLIPSVKRHINVPLIAAGGIATGRGMLAAMALGADGVQIGSRFVATDEASSHINFKRRVLEAGEGDTILTLKELAPVRLLKNPFYEQVLELYRSGEASAENIKKLLGKGRTKKGMFEGDLTEGELEIGQIASVIDKIQPVSEVFQEIIDEYNFALSELNQLGKLNF